MQVLNFGLGAFKWSKGWPTSYISLAHYTPLQTLFHVGWLKSFALHLGWVDGWMGGCRMRLFLLVSLLGFHCCFALLPRLDGSRLNYQCKSFLKRHKPLFIFFLLYISCSQMYRRRVSIFIPFWNLRFPCQ